MDWLRGFLWRLDWWCKHQPCFHAEPLKATMKDGSIYYMCPKCHYGLLDKEWK